LRRLLRQFAELFRRQPGGFGDCPDPQPSILNRFVAPASGVCRDFFAWLAYLAVCLDREPREIRELNSE
jgi:hypothetical protein